VLPLLVLGAVVLRQRGFPRDGVWAMAGVVALGAWWFGFFAVHWYRPRYEARAAGARRLLEVSRVRRVLLVAAVLPAWFLLARVGEAWVASGVTFALAAVVWIGTGVRFLLDEGGLERIGGLHRRTTVPWHRVTGVRVYRTDIWLEVDGSRLLAISARQTDGYPELAEALLRHLPPGTAGLDQGRVILEEQAALLRPPSER